MTIDPPTKQNGQTISDLEALLLITSGSMPKSSENLTTLENLANVQVSTLYLNQLPLEEIFTRLGAKDLKVRMDTEVSQNSSIQPVLNFTIESLPVDFSTRLAEPEKATISGYQ